jgi:hypothetical protein
MAGTKFYTADRFIKEGGTSSQFLKADGTIDTNTYLTSSSSVSTEDVQDIVGAMVSSNTETNISVTYNDSTGKLNFSSTQRGIHDTPVNGATTTSISSNWAFDNVKTAVPSGAVFTDTNTTYVSSDFTHDDLTGFVANEHIDWTTDQGSTNIHANNITGYLKDTTDTFTGTLTLNGDINVNSGDVTVDEGQMIVLDDDGDSFATIYSDVSGNSENVYTSINGHNFVNGDDNSFDFVKAGSFIKDGGTSSQFLKADGSVDSNTYLTSSSTQSKYLRSDQADTTTGTLTAPKFYVSAATASSQWAFQARNSSSTADSGIYFSGGDGNLLLRNSSNSLTARIDSDGNSYIPKNLGIGTTNPASSLGSGRVLKISSTGNGEVNLDHTDTGTTSDIGLFSFSRAGDHLAHMKATHDGSTTSAFLSFHTQSSGGSYSNASSNERMRISSSGNVGIGLTNPGLKFEVKGNSRVLENKTSDTFFGVFNGGSASSTTTSTIMVGEFGNTPKIWLRNYRDGSASQELGYAGTFRIKSGQIGSATARLTITSGGDATFTASVTSTNFITSSDSRLKDNVKTVDNSHIDVDWKTFELKSNKGQKRYGVIAQELEEKHPEFVRTNDEGMKSVAYMDLLIAKIAELEARLEKVEK